MSIQSMIEESISDWHESELLKKKADQLAIRVRKEISRQARALAHGSENDATVHRGIRANLIARWRDGEIERVILVDFLGQVLSVSTPSKCPPSGRPSSIQILAKTPLEYLPEHFAPLMNWRTQMRPLHLVQRAQVM